MAAHASSLSIAVLDATMPNLSGQQVAEKIRESRPKFPVVLCTGHLAPTVLPPADEDVTRVVSKPMDWKSLLTAIRELLAHSKIDNA